MFSRVRDMPAYDQATAMAIGNQLADASPQAVLQWAIEEFGDGFCIASSGSDAVLVDMASRIRGGVDVVFADTSHHFAETLSTMETMLERYDVNLVFARAERSLAEQELDLGASLFLRDPDLCCWTRKVEPFNASLSRYSAWASGIRRDQAPTRQRTEVVEWDAGRRMVKVNPLAFWTQEDVDAYIADFDVVVNPLHAAGYPSIGCAPCTVPTVEGADQREGRWIGLNKTECGLHVPLATGS